MANNKGKHPMNVPGAWYTTQADDKSGDGCIACTICYAEASKFFKEDDDGNAYVYNQPTTPAEIQECMDQLESCSVASIGNDG